MRCYGLARRPVHGLERADFRLFDDGEPREISDLWHEQDLPLTLGIVIDTSESQRDLAGAHREAAAQFLERIVRPGDRAFVVSVDADVTLRSEVTGGRYGLKQSLLSPLGAPLGVPCGRFADRRPICGGTALWNAVYASAEHMRRFTGTKALILLTDGHDTGSTHTLAVAAEAAQRADAVVYAIQFPDADGPAQSPELEALVLATGGLLLPATRSDTAELLDRANADLRDRYVLAFHAPDGTAAIHKIHVDTVRPGLTVRARREYAVSQ